MGPEMAVCGYLRNALPCADKYGIQYMYSIK